MIHEALGDIDYDERGQGPTLVLVPGSWSTGSAWKAVAAALGGDHRIVTTSLLGYGGTTERRTEHDTSIAHEVAVVERVIAEAGGPVHLVGHSFGAWVCLAVAMRAQAGLLSLTLLEATAFDALRAAGERERYDEVVAMRDAYVHDFAAGDREAARRVIDFYGGDGSFDAMLDRIREGIAAGTPTNILDWASALALRCDLADYGAVAVPALVVRGSLAHRCVGRAAEIVAAAVPVGRLAAVAGASHFMLSTHPGAVAAEIRSQVQLARPYG